MNNKRIPLAGHAYHKKSDAELHYIVKDAGEAARAMKGHNAQAEAKYLDQVNDASTVLHYRKKLSVSEANSLKREQPMPSIFDDPFNSVSAFHESFKVPVDENHLKPGTKLKNGDEELTVEKPVGKDKYVVKEESIDESPSPFNWKEYAAAKKEGQLRNHTTSKSSSGGTVYKKKEELEDEPKGGESESGEKKKRGRPAGWTGEYKKRSAETVAASRAKRAATLAAKKAADSPIKTEEFFAEMLEDFSSSEIMDFLLDEEVLSLDELSKATLGSYIKKANRSATGLATNAMHLKNTADTHRDLSHEFPSKEGRKEHAKKSDEYSKYSFDATQKQIKRTKGIEKATDKLMKEGVEGLTVEEFDELLESFESLDELSKQTLSSYIKKAANRATIHAYMKKDALTKANAAHEKGNDKEGMDHSDSAILRKKLEDKKKAGIAKAADKLAKEEVESIAKQIGSLGMSTIIGSALDTNK